MPLANQQNAATLHKQHNTALVFPPIVTLTDVTTHGTGSLLTHEQFVTHTAMDNTYN